MRAPGAGGASGPVPMPPTTDGSGGGGANYGRHSEGPSADELSCHQDDACMRRLWCALAASAACALASSPPGDRGRGGGGGCRVHSRGPANPAGEEAAGALPVHGPGAAGPLRATAEHGGPSSAMSSPHQSTCRRTFRRRCYRSCLRCDGAWGNARAQSERTPSRKGRHPPNPRRHPHRHTHHADHWWGATGCNWAMEKVTHR